MTDQSHGLPVEPSADQPITHHKIEANGISTHFVRAGAGELVVLLHGFPETCFAWRKVIPDLARHYTVIAPDLRGCGDTDKPEADYDNHTVANDIRQLVQQLGLGPVRLVGHDIGMRAAYAYAASFPAEVKRLCFMEGVLPGFGLEELYDALKFPRMYHLTLFEAPNGLAEALISGRESIFVEHFIRQQTYDPFGPEQDALDEYARRIASPGALRGGIALFRTHKLDAERNRVSGGSKLSMPVLTIGGSASFGGRNLEKRTRELAQNVKGVILDDCGHYPAEEQPQHVIDELLKFFAS
jgi:pimeloyl-ACP methyl ester carboxylesterase